MSKTIIGIIIGLIVIGGAYYLITKNGPTSSLPSGTVPTSTVPAPVVPTTSNTSQPTNATVNIQNFSFNPSTLSVKTGTTVIWKNNDAVTHTITSDSGDLLKSQGIAPGQSFSFTFTTPGSFPYHCSIHTMMKGAVSVTN